jgi:hypothetical protein
MTAMDIDSECKIPQDFWDIAGLSLPCPPSPVPCPWSRHEMFKIVRPWDLAALLDTIEKGTEDLKTAVTGALPESPPETYDAFLSATCLLVGLIQYSRRRYAFKRADIPRWVACAYMEFLDRCFSNPRFCTMFQEKADSSTLLRAIGRKCTELTEQAFRAPKDSDRDHIALFLGKIAIVSRHVTRLSFAADT